MRKVDRRSPRYYALVRERWVGMFHTLPDIKLPTLHTMIVGESMTFSPRMPPDDVPFWYEVEEAIVGEQQRGRTRWSGV